MACGLVTGDGKYFICMGEEVTVFFTGEKLRGLSVTLFLDGPKLWQDFKDNLLEDFVLHLSHSETRTAALQKIDLKLQLHKKFNENANASKVNHRQTEYERVNDFDRPEQKK